MKSFYTESPIAARYGEIAGFYDTLYKACEDSWSQLAGRGRDFHRWVADLVAKCEPQRVLEIGCGEGYLLAELASPERAGIEISRRAAEAAAARSGAEVSLGCAEELPYATEYFDCAISIGVMTHFLDDLRATKQIARVLKPGGYYILGIFLRPSLRERAATKIAEFALQPGATRQWLRWLGRKLRLAFGFRRLKTRTRTDWQPVERMYTEPGLCRVLTQSGFAVRQVFTKRTHPDSPLAGAHFRVYLLQKPDTPFSQRPERRQGGFRAIGRRSNGAR